MKNNKLQNVVLKKGDYLVEHLPDYFKKKELGSFSSKVRKADNCFAGIVRKVEPVTWIDSILRSLKLQSDKEGYLVYYQKDVCPVVELLPDIGEYQVVNINYIILFLSEHCEDEY